VLELNSLAQRYAHVCDFLLVYIAEAHANDEWPIGNVIDLPQHRSTQQRIDAAKQCIEATQIEWRCVVARCDDDDDPFERLYAPWPLRFFIVARDDASTTPTLRWVSITTNGGYYDMIDIERSLQRACGVDEQ